MSAPPAYRVTVHASDEGWLLKRPGWPGEWFDDAGWATRAAESLAFEFHERSGRDACVVLASNDGGETLLCRFGPERRRAARVVQAACA